MKPVAIAGVIVLALGLFGLVYGGVTSSSHDTVIDIGLIHATADREKTFPVSPLVGATAVVCGVLLLRAGAGRRSSGSS